MGAYIQTRSSSCPRDTSNNDFEVCAHKVLLLSYIGEYIAETPQWRIYVSICGLFIHIDGTNLIVFALVFLGGLAYDLPRIVSPPKIPSDRRPYQL